MSITDPLLIEQYAHIHRSKAYGRTCHGYAVAITACLIDLKPGVVVEYGCGQSELGRTLPHSGRWVRYDPAIPGIDRLDESHADFVINTDVLEHVPEQDVDDVLAHIASLSGKVFFAISTRPALEILPDGRNAHCTVWPASRWKDVLARHFPDITLAHEKPGQSCIFVTWKSGVAELIGAIEDLRAHADRATGRKTLRQRLVRRLSRIVRGTAPA